MWKQGFLWVIFIRLSVSVPEACLYPSQLYSLSNKQQTITHTNSCLSKKRKNKLSALNFTHRGLMTSLLTSCFTSTQTLFFLVSHRSHFMVCIHQPLTNHIPFSVAQLSPAMLSLHFKTILNSFIAITEEREVQFSYKYVVCIF